MKRAYGNQEFILQYNRDLQLSIDQVLLTDDYDKVHNR